MKKLSQEALYGPLLTDDMQYRRDVVQLSPLDPQREQHLLACAKTGDTEARNELFTSHILRYIEYWSRRLFVTYAWASYRIEYADLIQVASIAVLEHFDHALSMENPLAYLCACAKYEMRAYCFRYSSLIVTPRTQENGKVVSPRRVESLDVPFNDETDETLKDILEDENWQCCAKGDEKACERLYQALSQLTEKQRAILMRLFGLGECPQEALADLQRELNVSHATLRESRDSGLKHIQQFLSPETQNHCTRQQACERLGIDKDSFSGFARRYGLMAVSYGMYDRSEIEALAQEREACLATGRKRMKRQSPKVA